MLLIPWEWQSQKQFVERMERMQLLRTPVASQVAVHSAHEKFVRQLLPAAEIGQAYRVVTCGLAGSGGIGNWVG